MEYFVTITGIQYHYDAKDLKTGEILVLRKEPYNKHDEEAIAVYTMDNEQVGYVAKACSTQAKGTYSAGRIYDKFEETVNVQIMFILHNSAIAKVLLDEKEEEEE